MMSRCTFSSSVAFVALCFCHSLALAAIGPFELDSQNGVDSKRDYGKRMRSLRPLAEHGNAEAQKLLADMYVLGSAAPQNFTEAAKWYRMAAEQGQVKAALQLGKMYHEGKGVIKDKAAAMNWIKKAANSDDATIP